MRARALAAALALGVVTCAVLPSAAIAKPGYFVLPGYRAEQAQLRGTHGYRIDLAATVAGERVGRSIKLTASKSLPHGAAELVAYSRRLHRKIVTGFDLELGREGHIDLRFVPHKIEEVAVDQDCTGEPTVVETGDFVGTIDLRGRRGFTRVEARRAAGTETTHHREICRRVKTPKDVDVVGISPSTPPPEGEVHLIAGDRSGSPRFDAVILKTEAEFSLGEVADFSAGVSRHTHGLDMFSTVIASRPGSTFTIPDPLDPHHETTVEPTAPFTGSAEFELASARHAEFSGDLAVKLPGFGRVSLTGSGIRSGLCEGATCTDTLPWALRPPGTDTFSNDAL